MSGNESSADLGNIIYIIRRRVLTLCFWPSDRVMKSGNGVLFPIGLLRCLFGTAFQAKWPSNTLDCPMGDFFETGLVDISGLARFKRFGRLRRSH